MAAIVATGEICDGPIAKKTTLGYAKAHACIIKSQIPSNISPQWLQYLTAHTWHESVSLPLCLLVPVSTDEVGGVYNHPHARLVQQQHHFAAWVVTTVTVPMVTCNIYHKYITEAKKVKSDIVFFIHS